MSERIVITGANRGIGLALCQELLKHGHRVHAGTRNPAASDRLGRLESQWPVTLTVLPLDINDTESVVAAAARVDTEQDGLDILVNNAAVFPEEGDESIEDIRLEWFDEAFHTNVTGTVRVIKAFLPALRKSERPRIANISSGAGSIASHDNHRMMCYGASKAALNHVTRSLAADLDPIIVTAISPGWVRTDMGGPNANLSPEESAQALARTILNLSREHSSAFLGRDGTPDGYAW